ncbi:MAG: Ig-like domain-containing protein, partial [Desulfofustis sp.]|nr:Ig-like domain-containing protein [Desulfofustis sp.]
ANTTPTFFVEANMSRYTDPNNDGVDEIALLAPAQATAGNVPGVAILVTVSHALTGATFTGYGAQVGGSRLFSFTPAAALPDGVYSVSAALQVFDSGTPTINDEGPSTHPLRVTIDTQPPTGTVPDLLVSSDSGTLNNDHVTNIQAPAFQGTGEPNARVRILANGVIVGQGTVTPDGIWEVTVEPLRDGQYAITAQFEDAAGNLSDPTLAMEPPLVIDTVEPNTPYLDLLNDTGRNSTDEVTNQNLLQFLMVGNDTVGGNGNPLPHDAIYRLYWRPGNAAGEVLVYDSLTEFGTFTTLGQLTRTVSQTLNNPGGTPFPDGLHNFKLEVEDRAGNISHDFLLTVVVDVQSPPVFFGMSGVGDDGLHADSDSGVPGAGNQTTLADRVTNDTTPTFWGRAEANAIVQAHIDVNGDGVVDGGDIFIGTTVAVPLDGNHQFPGGYWELSSVVDMNDSTARNLLGILSPLPLDGLRRILVTAEDVAGNVREPQMLRIFIDTQGPQLYDPDGAVADQHAIEITGNPGFNLFDLKDANGDLQGPTPLIRSLTIHVQDLPHRDDVDANFMYEALSEMVATQPGHYLVVGDHNGVIPIEQVIVVNAPRQDGQPARATVELRFFDPLPDDRFTLTISDAMVDPAGNALDGESNAVEPNGAPQFPSGDGQPGGNFVARFTVDSRAEIGVWAAGSVYVDTNGNFVHDPDGQNGDFTNRDITYMFGLASDHIIAGNFVNPANPGDPANEADGFHKLAAYGRFGATNRWLIDTDNHGVPNLNLPDGLSIDGLPLAGRFWDGVVRGGINIDPDSDQVGVKAGTTWYLDTNANLITDAGDVVLAGNMPGMPLAGDFDGDGIDDLSSWVDDMFYIDLSSVRTNGPLNPNSYDPDINGFWDVRFASGFTGVRERPVAADFDGDGIDDIGLWVPDRSGATPVELAEWYMMTSGFEETLFDRAGVSAADLAALVLPTVLQMPFKPYPFGDDIYAQFGDNFALPVVGNFDPPVVPFNGDPAGPLRDTNSDDPADVNADGVVTPLDALVVVNTVNHPDKYVAQGVFKFSSGPHPDVNGDSFVTALDVLLVINQLNQGASTGAEGESSVGTTRIPLISEQQPLQAAASSLAPITWSSAPADWTAREDAAMVQAAD